MTEVRRLTTGINQSGVRAYNERLILTMLQRGGPTPGRDLARQSGLSPQTVSVILRKLEADALVLRGAPQRGKVGKPSVPVALNPDGLFSVGLKIGRRSADLVLMDFAGNVRTQYHLHYAYPTPGEVFVFLRDGLVHAHDDLSTEGRDRICGIGIAAPFELWNWHELAGAPAKDFETWKTIDIQTEVRKFTDLPIFVNNDATAACRAEQIYGNGKHYRDYAYFFVAAFVGGGIVMNHLVVEGPHGNAGAFGPMPLPGPDGTPVPLMDVASIRTLETRLEAEGLDRARLWQEPQNWDDLEEFIAPWIEQAGAALALASLTACSVIDFEAVLIDGALPPEIRRRLADRVRDVLPTLDMRGIIVPRIAEGRIGGNARAIGAATRPINAAFLIDEFAGLLAPDGAD